MSQIDLIASFGYRGWVLLGAWIALLIGPIAPVGADTGPAFRSLKELRERGVVMQQWESSCAAAAVATVLTYGFDDPTSEQRAASGMLALTDAQRVKSRGGFSLLDLKRYADALGYAGAAYKQLSLADLALFHAPIVPINQHGYHHYIVVNRVTATDVLVADPAFGNRKIRIGRFQRIWLDGMAFILRRSPENIVDS